MLKPINIIFLFSILSTVCTAQVDKAGLLSHWTLDENNGLVAIDNIGNNNGILINSPLWHPTTGQWGGALEFDGTDDRVDIGTLDIPGSEMSISFWFKADDFDVNDARFISKATGTSGNSHYWMISAINKTQLRFRLKTNGKTTKLISPIDAITTGQWQHVTATYDGNKMKIYHNGELVASTVKKGQIDTNNSIHVAIGNQPINAGSKPFDGLIDDIRIYTAALTIKQIKVIIAGTTPKTEIPITTTGNNQTIKINQADDSSELVVAVNDVLPSILLTSPNNGKIDTTPPYAISWDTLQDDNGAYTLVEKAYDATGNMAISTPVKGVIDNVIITNSGLINPQVKPARTTCVAPCSIFFDASATTSATTKRPFHELNYRWNFDDAGAGKWAWTGKSRNKTTGAVTTHVFESAGVYNVALLVRDVDGNTATKQTTITIVDPDSFYSDNKTFCFSKSSDFSGCPTSLASQHITTSNIQVIEKYIGSGKRLLLHRGDSWSTDSSIQLAGPGPNVLGAFGTCLSADARGICANAPKIKITNASSQGISSSWNNPMVDWRVMDIELSGPSNSKDHGFAARHNNQHILLLRMNIHDFYGLVYADNSSTYTNGNVTVANSKLIHSIGGQGANNMWYSGNNMSILGNEVNDSRETEHVIRSPYLNGGVISNNVLLNQAPYKHVLKLHAPDWSKFGLYSQKIVISDNKFKSSNLDSASWIVAIQPQRCNNDDPTDERIRNVVVERNLFEAGTYTQVGLIVGSRDVTIRNNLFNMAKGKFQRVVQVGQCNIEPKPLNVGVINNSFYSTYTGDFTAIAINSTATNTAVVNNLAYAPNSSNPRLFSGSAFAQNNLLMDTNGYVKTSPVNPDNFKLKASSPAIDSGTDDTKVLLDFELRHRSSVSNTRDIGAFEQ